MAEPKDSIRDVLIGFKEQATWGTAETTGFNQLDVEPTEFSGTLVKRRDGKQPIGSRIKSASDVLHDTKGVMPEISLTGFAKKLELADMLYSALQSVVEDATTPFKKTFTPHASQPQFDSSAGFFRTVGIVYPQSAQDHVCADMVTRALTLTCRPSANNGFMTFSEQLVGRGAVTVANTLNTSGWSRKAQTHFNFFDLARGTIDFGGGAQALNWKDGFELQITWNAIEGIGQSSGQFASTSISDLQITLNLSLTKGSIWQTCRTTWEADTTVDVNIGWGNATPGSVDGDLDFALNGKIINVTPDNGELLGGTVEIEAVEETGVEALTVILADAVDRAW